jgi:hypothetical protein
MLVPANKHPAIDKPLSPSVVSENVYLVIGQFESSLVLNLVSSMMTIDVPPVPAIVFRIEKSLKKLKSSFI